MADISCLNSLLKIKCLKLFWNGSGLNNSNCMEIVFETFKYMDVTGFI